MLYRPTELISQLFFSVHGFNVTFTASNCLQLFFNPGFNQRISVSPVVPSIMISSTVRLQYHLPPSQCYNNEQRDAVLPIWTDTINTEEETFWFWFFFVLVVKCSLLKFNMVLFIIMEV